jgi:hypothetical protein
MKGVPFHGGNAGSDPAGDANLLNKLWEFALSLEGSKGFDKERTSESAHLLGGLAGQNHPDDSALRLALRLGHRLGIYVGRQLVVRVPQQFLDGLDVFAIGFHQGSKTVP